MSWLNINASPTRIYHFNLNSAKKKTQKNKLVVFNNINVIICLLISFWQHDKQKYQLELYD